MQTMDAQVDSSTFTGFDDFLFYLLAYFGNYLFDACRVDASVRHQLVQCKACNLAANRVEG